MGYDPMMPGGFNDPAMMGGGYGDPGMMGYGAGWGMVTQECWDMARPSYDGRRIW